jgi:hypothetical protein
VQAEAEISRRRAASSRPRTARWPHPRPLFCKERGDRAILLPLSTPKRREVTACCRLLRLGSMVPTRSPLEIVEIEGETDRWLLTTRLSPSHFDGFNRKRRAR